MLSALALAVALQSPTFAPPTLWAAGFAAPPRIPLVGDVDADGYADLICVYPPGGSIIDVCLNRRGQKPGVPFQALNPWGKDCQAAVAGDFDDKPGIDVAGFFDGDTIHVAGGFENGKLKDSGPLVKLPEKLANPFFQAGGGGLVVLSPSGRGYAIDLRAKTVERMSIPAGLAWADGKIAMDSQARIGRWEPTAGGRAVAFRPESTWPKINVRSRPGSVRIGDSSNVVIDRNVWVGRAAAVLEPTGLPAAPSHQFFADMDKDGDLDIVEYRYGAERHTAFDILVYRSLSANNLDEDADGLPNDKEKELQTNPTNPDTDNDGLLDGWEVGSHHDFDFKAIGCNPRRIDLICLISRYSNVDENHVKKELDRVKATYAGLDVANPDGSKGWSFHAVYLDPVQEKDHASPWWANRDKFRPAKWKGLVHWMQIGPGGGGQADQMGDGGGCGANALWAVFLHEFGHQIGMDHNGFWEPGLCPLYTSMMNYAYSYGYEDDGAKIHYSNGRFRDFVLDERNLDETLPFAYDQVKFLEKGPYRFRLKQNGPTTMVDWNWNGIFGEKNIRADINYSYSTNAGRRDEIGKIMTSPFLFVHGGKAWSVYGTHKFPGDVKTDPSVSVDKPGTLLIRKLKEPFKWEEPMVVELSQKGGPVQELVGDPVAVSKDGWIYVVYPGRKLPNFAKGVALVRVREKGKGLDLEGGQLVATNERLVPSVGLYKNRLYIFLWNPDTNQVTYRTLDKGLEMSPERTLIRRSTIPVGMAVDTLQDEILLGAAEDQDTKKTNRWQIRRYKELSGRLVEKSVEWIEGEAGGSRGNGRCTVLFDASKEAGKVGRIYFYGRGLTSKESPWACTYVAHQIADKSIRGGWLVKRFYDEWTQSRSAPTAAWFGGDIIWAYRWVDGSQGDRDNLFHVGYRGLGIDDKPMGDHDDIAFFRDIGIRHSILWLGGN